MYFIPVCFLEFCYNMLKHESAAYSSWNHKQTPLQKLSCCPPDKIRTSEIKLRNYKTMILTFIRNSIINPINSLPINIMVVSFKPYESNFLPTPTPN